MYCFLSDGLNWIFLEIFNWCSSCGTCGNVSTYAMTGLGLKLEELLKKKGLENKANKAHSFEKLSNNDPLLLQNSAGATDQEKENPIIKDKIDTRKEIANFANTSHDTVMKVKKIGTAYSIFEKEFTSRSDAINWIIDNLLSAGRH
jgi:hypothetical protein